MTNFAAASWNNPISIPVVATDKETPKAIPPLVYVGNRASTAIRVLQLRPEPVLTKEAEERGELTHYPEDVMVISVHGVINRVDHSVVVNATAKDAKNRNVFFVEFYAFAADVQIETVQTKRGEKIEIITRAKLLSPTYNQPVPVLCNDTQTSVLKCSLSLDGAEPGCVQPVLMGDGLQKRLNGGKGEPLFTPKDLLIHSSKGDNKKKQPQQQPAIIPTINTEAPKPIVEDRPGRRKQRRGSRGKGKSKSSTSMPMKQAFAEVGLVGASL